MPDLRFAPVGQHLKPVMAADQRDLLLAMEQNLAERACHLHRELAGATVIRAHDLVIADSGSMTTRSTSWRRPGSHRGRPGGALPRL
jgi:hypothetical protein